VVTIIKSSGFVTLTMMAALIVVPLTGNSFHNIFSYAQTTDTTAKHGSLNNRFHSAFDTFVVPRCKI